MEVTCYGGVSEIGGNQILLESGDGSLFLDFGQSFKAEGYFFEEFLQPRSKSAFFDLSYLGLLPEINGIYRKDVFYPEGVDTCSPISRSYWTQTLESFENAKTNDNRTPDAVFISHAHLDHCGYIGYLGNIPLYCSEETRILMKTITEIGNQKGFEKELDEFKYRTVKTRASGFFPGSPYVTTNQTVTRTYPELKNKIQTETENGISITGFNVSHSVPGAMACLIETDDTQILYSGDIRFHGRNNPDLSGLDGLSPDLMICEGTNIDDTEPDNEEKVQEEITDHISKTEELVMVGFAWKDLERYETVRDAAQSEGRIPVFDPRLAYTLARLGRDIYSEGASVFVERCESMIFSPGDYSKQKHKAGLMEYDLWDNKKATRNTDITHLEKGVFAHDLRSDPNAYVLHLDYYRFKNLLDIKPNNGSIYIRAQCEPFNKRMELSYERLENWLRFFKINPENNFKPYQCHASGHACGPDIKEFIERVHPKKVIPIHTENPKAFETLRFEVVIPQKNLPISI